MGLIWIATKNYSPLYCNSSFGNLQISCSLYNISVLLLLICSVLCICYIDEERWSNAVWRCNSLYFLFWKAIYLIERKCQKPWLTILDDLCPIYYFSVASLLSEDEAEQLASNTVDTLAFLHNIFAWAEMCW